MIRKTRSVASKLLLASACVFGLTAPQNVAIAASSESTPPAIELKFSPGILAVSPDGNLAFAAGADMIGFPNNDRPVPLALIDLKNQKVLATHPLQGGLSAAAVDSHFAYVGSQSADVLFVLNHKDLTQARRVFTQGRVQQIICVDDRLLFFKTATNESPTVLSVPSCEPAAPSDVGLGFHLAAKGKSLAAQMPVPTGDDWWYDGILYDSHLKKPRVIVKPRGFWECGGDLSRQGMANRPYHFPGNSSVPAWLQPWGVTIDQQGIRRGTTQIGQFGMPFPSAPPVALTDQPAVVRISYNQDRNATRLAELQFYDVVTGGKALTVPLLDNESGWQMGAPFGPGNPIKLQVRKDKLICQILNRIIVVPVPKLDPRKFPPNITFELDQAVAVVGAEDKEFPLPKVQNDSEGPVEMSLLPEIPGADLTNKGSQLRLQGAVLRSKAIESPQPFSRVNQTVLPGQSRDYAGGAAMYMREVAPFFEKIVGRKPDGVPLWMCVGLIARDKGLQAAEFEYGVMLEIPLEQAQAKERRTGMNFTPQPFPAPPGSPGFRPPGSSNVDQRIDNLEREVRRMNARLDKVMQMLKDKSDSGQRKPQR